LGCDSKPAALDAIMKEWTSDKLFPVRCNNLEAGIPDPSNPRGIIQLMRKTKSTPKDTVLDDRAHDVLLGMLGSD
jgi:hypothetical protein